jgi:hypothetical protein
MPYINFNWSPKSDHGRVSTIADDLEALADEHNISFYVNAKEEEERQPVVVPEGVSLPSAAVERLRGLAAKAGVTIYVHGPD